jgi:hypothetical protein
VRTDFSDGKRKIKVQRIKGTTALFFKAKFAVDADGAARAYSPDNDPEALDLVKNATPGSKNTSRGRRRTARSERARVQGSLYLKRLCRAAIPGMPMLSSTRQSVSGVPFRANQNPNQGANPGGALARLQHWDPIRADWAEQ